MKNSVRLLLLLCILSFCFSCSRQKQYRIGVSQCSNDGWRQKVNRELHTGEYLFDDLQISIASADNNNEKQVEQIDSFIREKVSLLVVAPSDMKTVAPAVSRAYKQGIPVILYDRKTNSSDFTAYIGSDNQEVGRLVANYMASSLAGRGHVLEITGIRGSSPVEDRHAGFQKAMKAFPGIQITTVEGDWTTETAEKLTQALVAKGDHFDAVFGHNDREAFGGQRALSKVGQKAISVGIDGLPGENEGISFVKNGKMTATYVYPTKGVEIVKLAMKILNDEPYERINYLQSTIIEGEEAEIASLQNEEMEDQSQNLETIYNKVDNYLKEYRTQQVVIAFLIFIVLLLAFLLFRIIYLQKARGQLHRLIAAEAVAPQADDQPAEQSESLNPDQKFMQDVRQAIQENMTNPDLKIEDLGDIVGLSRVQLYRKVKAFTGTTPVDLLRTARLERARQLLMTTDLTISEVAYQVGFSTPSYFTTCFKQQYGKHPKNIKA